MAGNRLRCELSQKGGRMSSSRWLVAAAIGAVALGSLAVGAIAVGALAVARLKVGSATFEELRVGKLHVDSLDVAGRPWTPPVD